MGHFCRPDLVVSLLLLKKCLEISQQRREELGHFQKESRLEKQKEGQEHLGRCQKGVTCKDRLEARILSRVQEQPRLKWGWGNQACGERECAEAVSLGSGAQACFSAPSPLRPALPACCVSMLSRVTLSQEHWGSSWSLPSTHVPSCLLALSMLSSLYNLFSVYIPQPRSASPTFTPTPRDNQQDSHCQKGLLQLPPPMQSLPWPPRGPNPLSPVVTQLSAELWFSNFSCCLVYFVMVCFPPGNLMVSGTSEKINTPQMKTAELG